MNDVNFCFGLCRPTHKNQVAYIHMKALASGNLLANKLMLGS